MKTAQTSNWFADDYRKIHLLWVWPDWAERHGQDFDAHRWIEKLKAAHVGAIEMQAKDHLGRCRYKTSLGPQGPDEFGELLEEAHLAGMKVLAWYDFQMDLVTLAEHPEWIRVSAEGTAPRNGILALGCINTPWREFALTQVEELVRQYPIDGFWFEWESIWGPASNSAESCYCISCRRRYRERFGRPMPLHPIVEEAREIYRWRIGLARSLTEEIGQILRSYRPEAVITYYGAGTPMDALDTADVYSYETHAAEFARRSFFSRWQRTRGKPFEMLTPSALPNSPDVGWCAWDSKPANVLALDAAIPLAQGAGSVFGVQAFTDGNLDCAQMEEIGKVFERVETLEPYVHGARSVAQVAILLAVDAQGLPDLRPAAEANALSWHSALLARHLLYDVVPDATTATHYSLVIVPDSVALSKEQTDLLADYVAGGGKLLVCGRSAFLDCKGHLNREEPLATLLGVRFCEVSEFPFVYAFPGGTVAGKGIPKLRILMKPQPLVVELADAETVVPMSLPENVFSEPIRVMWSYPGPAHDSVLPAVTSRAVGSGTAMYVAIPLETREFKDLWSRQLAANLVDLLLEDAWLETDAPAGVEVVLNQLDDKHVLHLIDHRAGDPIYSLAVNGATPAGITVALKTQHIHVSRAWVAPSEEPVMIEPQGDCTVLTLPAFDVSLVVVLEA